MMIAIFVGLTIAAGEQSKTSSCGRALSEQIKRVVDPDGLYKSLLGCRVNVLHEGVAVAWSSEGSADCLALWVVAVDRSRTRGRVVHMLWDGVQDAWDNHHPHVCSGRCRPWQLWVKRGAITVKGFGNNRDESCTGTYRHVYRFTGGGEIVVDDESDHEGKTNN